VTQSPDFAVKPTLAGDTVILRPFSEDDLPAMSEVLLDPEARILTGSVHDEVQARAPLARGEAKAARDWLLALGDQPDRLDLAVVDRESGACVGEAVLNQWDPGNQSCNFRIFIGPRGRDRGLGTEATRLIVGYGFEHLGLHRISLEVYAFNPRARRAYEKAGFRAEGVLRESLRYNGEWIDATVMSVLAPEWFALTEDNSKELSRTTAGYLAAVDEAVKDGDGNTVLPPSAAILVCDRSGAYRVPGVQAEDHLPPG
jgi:RimJ/RimL family protein N-acetyltransferase